MICICSRSWTCRCPNLDAPEIYLKTSISLSQLSFTRGTEWKEKRILWRFNALAL